MDNQDSSLTSLSEITAKRLVDFIVSRGLAQGDKLPNEKNLCAMLDVGRSTLREAIRMLSSRNILTTKHGSGIYLCENTGLTDDPLGFAFIKDKLKLMSDLSEFRLMIEPRCAAQAAMLATKSDVQELEQLCLNAEQIIISGHDFAKADSDFHNKIGAISGNSVMPRLSSIIEQSVQLFLHYTKADLTTATIRAHRTIVAAIAEGDPIKASDLMYLHLVQGRSYITHYMSLEEQAKNTLSNDL